MVKRKPVRSLSGVTVIALMCAPHECPGKCKYCPKGEYAPQSYTGEEPAALRAKYCDYDARKQVMHRLKQYSETGHDASKIEVVIMGGTFLSTDPEYKEGFIKGIYQALNNSRKNDLEVLKQDNEKALHRCVAMVIETRPDICGKEEVKEMLRYGCTRVELGAQSTNDKVLRNIGRGHSTSITRQAIKRLKNAGFKVDLHMMLGLPWQNELMDFKKLWVNPDWRPDGLKIYPALVIKGTELYDDWSKGKYNPLTNELALSKVVKVLEGIPYYVRVKRVMRDIPAKCISAGPTWGNLRQRAWNLMKKPCNCIRCREIGRRELKGKIKLKVRNYEASGGIEYFISYEGSNDSLIGFCRLRIIGRKAFIRELHVYGKTVPIGEKGAGYQHKGYGSKLLSKAEDVARNKGVMDLRVLSGAGVRNYYTKHGYELVEDYMIKNINK